MTTLVALHVLDKVEQGHEAAYLLARAARRAFLPDPMRARPVEIVHGVLRALNRLDRAASIAVRGETERLEPWRRQFLRVAALLGERSERLDELLPWADVLARSRERRHEAEVQGARAAHEARAFLSTAPKPGSEDLGLRTGHPAWLVKLAFKQLGPEAPALLAANNVDPPLVVRANTLRASRDAVADALRGEGFTVRPTRYSPVGLHVEPKEGAFRTKAFQGGLFEAQDEGSQLCALMLDAKPGEWVLDACAGAGGKTLLLAAAMQNRGRVIALDTHAGRLLELKRRASRGGVENYEAFVVAEDGALRGGAKALRRGESKGKLPRQQYDKVLVDAPCSGLGTLRRTPELRWRHAPSSIETYPARQAAILAQAAARVKPGGRLVYATCTITQEENEAVAQPLLAAGWRLLACQDALPEAARAPDLGDAQGFLRLWPHRHGTEGFFAAALLRPTS